MSRFSCVFLVALVFVACKPKTRSGAAPDAAAASSSTAEAKPELAAPIEPSPPLSAKAGEVPALEAKLVASDATVGAALGASVAYSDDTGALAVGASNAATPAGPARGAVYVYVFNGSTWTQRQKLYDPLGAAGDAFGFSIGLSENRFALFGPIFYSPSVRVALRSLAISQRLRM